MKENIQLSDELRAAVKAIKKAILQSQYRAAKSVNREQLSLYYGIGRYISEHSGKGFWGKGAIKQISDQLHKELPGMRGFSETSIKKMRQFYEEWAPSIRPPMAVELSQLTNRPPTAVDLEVVDYESLMKYHQPLTEKFNFEEFVSLSFTHHIEILNKTEKLEERLFYIHEAVTNKWDKYLLRDMLKGKLYEHQGEMPNNFAKTMPSPQSALRAIEMFKDEYLLDFINVEEIGARDEADVDEREVEQAIIQNVKNFIMTFGRDFTFVGNQYHLEKFGVEQYPDLLFFNRELAALVCVEIKRGGFKPAYLGQLSAYLRILDSEVKKPYENPSIGIVLCKQANKSFVEFLIQGYENPMGVATYKTMEDVRRVLPTEEELRRVIDEEI